MNLTMTEPVYQPRAPTYAPCSVWKMDDEPWIIPEVQTATIGTQTDVTHKPAKKKKASKQSKLVKLYKKAIDKHWFETEQNDKDKRKLRKILIDIFEDKKLCWTHAKDAGLCTSLRRIRKENKEDAKISKWVKGVEKLLKKKFNKHTLKV